MAYPITIFFATAAALSTPAMASEGPLKIASKIFVEQRALDRDGAVRATLVPATRAVPGDHVVFVLAYRNTGTQSLSDLVLDNPVPGAIRYSAAGAQSAAPEVSVDGKAYGTLGQLRIPVVGGGMRTATAADVKHVRWRLAMVPAGGQGQFAFNAILK